MAKKKRSSKSQSAPFSMATVLQSVLFRKSLGLVAFIGLIWGVGALISWGYARYLTQNKFFHLEPDQVVIRGCQTCPPETIKSWLELDQGEGCNLFTLTQSNKIDRIKASAPILRNVSMSVKLPNQVVITIEEREPLLRLPRQYMMVDQDGMVFRYRHLRSGLPMVCDFEEATTLVPGETLPQYMMAAIHLAQAASVIDFGDRLTRIALLNAAMPDDGLMLTFASGKQAKIAWPDLSTESAQSPVMVKTLQRLAMVMRSPNNLRAVFFNATVPMIISTSH